MIGTAPGNCAACCQHYRKVGEAKQQVIDHSRLAAARNRVALPVKQVIDTRPPCETCPKYKLFPSNWGLDPANSPIVQCYRLAATDHRVGTMAGAPLLHTLTLPDAIAAVDINPDWFPTWLHRKRAIDLLIQMGRVVSEVQRERERKLQEEAEAKAKRERR